MNDLFKFEYYSDKVERNPKTNRDEVKGFTQISQPKKWSLLSKREKADIILKADRICAWQLPLDQANSLKSQMEQFANAVGFQGETREPKESPTKPGTYGISVNKRPSAFQSMSEVLNDLQDDELLEMLAMGNR